MPKDVYMRDRLADLQRRINALSVTMTAFQRQSERHRAASSSSRYDFDDVKDDLSTQTLFRDEGSLKSPTNFGFSVIFDSYEDDKDLESPGFPAVFDSYEEYEKLATEDVCHEQASLSINFDVPPVYDDFKKDETHCLEPVDEREEDFIVDLPPVFDSYEDDEDLTAETLCVNKESLESPIDFVFSAISDSYEGDKDLATEIVFHEKVLQEISLPSISFSVSPPVFDDYREVCYDLTLIFDIHHDETEILELLSRFDGYNKVEVAAVEKSVFSILHERLVSLNDQKVFDEMSRQDVKTCCSLQYAFDPGIDSRSCDNAISSEAVMKLKIPTEKRPDPYALAWLSNKMAITVSKRWFVCLQKHDIKLAFLSLSVVYEEDINKSIWQSLLDKPLRSRIATYEIMVFLSRGWKFSWYEDSVLVQLNDDMEVLCVGSLGVDVDISGQDDVSKLLLDIFKSVRAFLTLCILSKFYHGFYTHHLWSLVHYMLPLFVSHGCIFDSSLWKPSASASKIFAQGVIEIINPEDDLGVHDYHLLIKPIEAFSFDPGISLKQAVSKVRGRISPKMAGMNTILQKAVMLEEYCCFYIDEQVKLSRLPVVLDEYTFDKDRVPEFCFPWEVILTGRMKISALTELQLPQFGTGSRFGVWVVYALCSNVYNFFFFFVIHRTPEFQDAILDDYRQTNGVVARHVFTLNHSMYGFHVIQKAIEDANFVVPAEEYMVDETIAEKDNSLVARGFQGKLIRKNLDDRGLAFVHEQVMMTMPSLMLLRCATL